ncbi:hypothetical protein TSUD_243990 [Trifolium subterraneum]|uniref:Uncharacterized protein n=1 Tax=Trifolium subterraneum TaxID=3900 RepID=A0A2Z6PGM2_TRISU|nr:hypothetical protein TSUD_243990 [Trifolium subterraneum]
MQTNIHEPIHEAILQHFYQDPILKPVEDGEILARKEIVSKDSFEDELSNSDIIVPFTLEHIENSNIVVFAEKDDSAIPVTQLWLVNMQDTQNRERATLHDLLSKQQQQKKKNKQFRSVGIPYHTCSKVVPPHHLLL